MIRKKCNKRVLYINLGNFGSTGKIVEGLSQLCEKEGYKVLKCYPQNKAGYKKKNNDYIICSETVHKINRHLAAATGFAGCFAVGPTLRLVQRIKHFRPDIIHLHNLHGDYINLPILFHYLKKCKKPIIWTLHDCWSFTGRCPYFQMSKCRKWKTGCYHCPFPKASYPQSKIDTSKWMWKKKRQWFTGLERVTLVTPSEWLAGVVAQSFLKKYPVQVIYNGIDLSIFKPTPSDVKQRLFGARGGGRGKYVILGVAFQWSIYKGIDVFVKLSKKLDDEYLLVVVGVEDRQKKKMPPNIACLDKCTDQRELASIYTAADVLLNPTREEVLGMTNLEALACGTPVVTFRTGGSPECLDKNSGYVVPDDGSIVQIIHAVKKVCLRHGKQANKKYCMQRASKFDERKVYADYLNLYKRVYGNG